jgi:hypothetical protein
MVQLAATIFVAIVAINVLLAILSAIANGIESASDSRRSAKIMKDAAARERNLFSMPMAELDVEIARLEEMDRDAIKGWEDDLRYDPSPRFRPRPRHEYSSQAIIIRGQRKQFDGHPDARLLPDGVKKLAELDRWRNTRAYMLKTSPLSTDTKLIDRMIADLEAEFAKARKGGPKVGDYVPGKGWRIV